jgi:antitoxin PrlF
MNEATYVQNNNRSIPNKKHLGTVTQKGQITIPVEVREYLQVQPNDKVAFEIRDGEVVLEKTKILSLDDVFGAVTPRNRPEDFKKLRDNAIEEHLEKSRSLRA